MSEIEQAIALCDQQFTNLDGPFDINLLEKLVGVMCVPFLPSFLLSLPFFLHVPAFHCSFPPPRPSFPAFLPLLPSCGERCVIQTIFAMYLQTLTESGAYVARALKPATKSFLAWCSLNLEKSFEGGGVVWVADHSNHYLKNQ